MIIYFSATGNSQYVSTKIAKEINEKTYSIIENKNTRKYESDKEIDTIITRIKNRSQGNYVARKIPKFISNMAQLWYDRSRKTKNLHITKTCIGCKKCINNCPINAITLINNKPSWQKEYCVMCLRCLHICPTFSIQYNNKTQKHGQYINPYIKKLD